MADFLGQAWRPEEVSRNTPIRAREIDKKADYFDEDDEEDIEGFLWVKYAPGHQAVFAPVNFSALGPVGGKTLVGITYSGD
jgi:hypothetical protein